MKLVVPKFATEAEEAKWRDDHMDIAEADLFEAIENGTAKHGGPQRIMREKRESEDITLRIPIAGLERSRKLAEKKGLEYETYVKTLLHEALDREEASVKKGRRRKTG